MAAFLRKRSLTRVRVKVEATTRAVLEAVPRGAADGIQRRRQSQATHGTMAGYYEIRVTGPGRWHYRLFCPLDNGTERELPERGFDRPQIAVINGMVEQHMTEFSDASTESTSAISATATSRRCRDRSPSRTPDPIKA
jgi:hypothetical protein